MRLPARLLSLFLLFPALTTQAQENALSYSEAQAEAGRQLYQQTCLRCHGPNLSDGPLGTPLKGPVFMQKYGGKPAVELFQITRGTMPTEAPGSLSAQSYAQLVAYLLQQNDIVPGRSELPADLSQLAGMTVPKGGFSFMDFSPYTPRESVALPNPLERLRPVSDADMREPPPADWLGWRQGWQAQGFSELAQINADNVDQLRLAWSWTLPAGSAEGVPLVRDGSLFVQAYGDVVQALDAASGDLLWQYSPVLEPGASPFHKRGITLHGDTLYLGTSDVHVVALDARSGEERWKTRVGDFTVREGLNGGPLVAEGRVLIGTTGTGVGAVPGGPQIVGLDAATGEIVWRLGTIPKEDEPGGQSWNGMPWQERSGASVWTPASYDPQSGLAYFGTGNTYDTGPLLKPNETPGVSNDALYTNSTLALRPRTGELVWHYQHFPNDQWDLDWAFERQIVDLEVDGKTRHAVITAGKTGIYEGLDAASGEFLFALDLGLQNLVTAIDPASGAKTVDASKYPDGSVQLICPHGAGAKNYLPASWQADARRLFVPLNEACMDLYPVPGGGVGGLSSGVNWGIRPRPDSDGKYGRLAAYDLERGEALWLHRQRAPLTSGVLATRGGLVFAAALDRVLRAHDARDGNVLWEARLNDVSSSSPISYEVDGRQYLALVVGEGGFHARSFAPLVPELRSPANRGAALWVFALPER